MPTIHNFQCCSQINQLMKSIPMTMMVCSNDILGNTPFQLTSFMSIKVFSVLSMLLKLSKLGGEGAIGFLV